MQKIKLTLLTILCIIITGQVKASTLNSLDTKVYLDENGDGHVSETWNYTIDEGTENYHSFGQLEDRQITDFSVSMDGKTYTNIGTWNVDATKEEKSYKNGINYTADGLELCHGIEYGTHTYNVNYTVKNLVWTYNDSQILYFTFLPQNMTTPPKKYQLTIYGDKQYRDLKYSSYGFKSTNNIKNGKIIFKSNGNLQSDEYVVALIGFPLGTFNTEISKQGTYNDIAKSALEGAKQNKTNNVILPLLTFFIVFALVFVI